MDLLEKEHPRISAGTGLGYGKSGHRDVCKTVEDRAKFTINCLYTHRRGKPYQYVRKCMILNDLREI